MGAWLGSCVLALPAVWLGYETSWWSGTCDQTDSLGFALLLNLLAIALLGFGSVDCVSAEISGRIEWTDTKRSLGV